jgi:DNA-binding Lrp family transcriptional regulator
VIAWSFLTNHGKVLLCLAQDPDIRLRDIAGKIGITERRAYEIVDELTKGGYVIKQKVGRRNHYQILDHAPLPESIAREQAIGDVLHVISGGEVRRRTKDKIKI